MFLHRETERARKFLKKRRAEEFKAYRIKHAAIAAKPKSKEDFLKASKTVSKDVDVDKMYEKYLQSFITKPIKKFFDDHCKNAWFRERYHPLSLRENRNKLRDCTKQRLNVFNSLTNSDTPSVVALVPSNKETIVKLLNKANFLLKNDGSDAADSQSCNSDDVEVFACELHNGILVDNIPYNISGEMFKEFLEQLYKFETVIFPNMLGDVLKPHTAILFSVPEGELESLCSLLNCLPIENINARPYRFTHENRVLIADPIFNNELIAKLLLLKAVQLVVALDKRAGIFTSDNNQSYEDTIKDIGRDFDSCVHDSTNPVIRNVQENSGIKNFRILQKDAYEDLASVTTDGSQILEYLDTLVLYLRVVHGFDFFDLLYVEKEYLYPIQYWRFHIRAESNTNNEISPELFKKYENMLNSSLDQFISIDLLTEEEMAYHGQLDPEEAVDKLISDNTQMLSEDRYLCPLSGKKFKGPQFIRKHIFSKFEHLVHQARSEKQFYNNYLIDRKRPHETLKKILDPRMRREDAPIVRETDAPKKQREARRKVVRYDDVHMPDFEIV